MIKDVRDEWRIRDIESEVRHIKNQLHRFADIDEIRRLNTEIMNLNMGTTSIGMGEELQSQVNQIIERLQIIEQKLGIGNY